MIDEAHRSFWLAALVVMISSLTGLCFFGLHLLAGARADGRQKR